MSDDDFQETIKESAINPVWKKFKFQEDSPAETGVAMLIIPFGEGKRAVAWAHLLPNGEPDEEDAVILHDLMNHSGFYMTVFWHLELDWINESDLEGTVFEVSVDQIETLMASTRKWAEYKHLQHQSVTEKNETKPRGDSDQPNSYPFDLGLNLN